MLKKPLPNEFYDIGFIFLNPKNASNISPSTLVEGYYLVDIDPGNAPIDIKKERKKIGIAELDNLKLAKKLLLAPSIQHYVFYPRGSETEIATMLSLFPSNKFNKFAFYSRNELENLFNLHLRNKGRLARSLIFVNPKNIE